MLKYCLTAYLSDAGATKQKVKEFVEDKLTDKLRDDYQDITIWDYGWKESTDQANTLEMFTKSD